MSATAIAAGTHDIGRPRRRSQFSWLRSLKVRIGLAIIGAFALLGIFGPLLAPHDPSATSQDLFAPPSAAHWLGTTSVGQDVLSQLLAGTRLSLEVGLTAAVLGEAMAILVGVTAGHFGGAVDEALSLLTNIFLVIPVLPLQILIVAYVGNTGWFMLAVVIALTAWPHGARQLRAQTLSTGKRDYVVAARAAGEPAWRIINFEILPNLLAIVVTGFLFQVLAAIIVQTSLAFLGLGDLTSWSWGTILYWSQDGNAFLTGAWWWYVPPGVCLALLGMGLAMVNLGIDEVINPRLRHAGRRRLCRRANTATRTRNPFSSKGFQSHEPGSDPAPAPGSGSGGRRRDL
jgi:peptide/nickel transport system permease protein